VDSESKNIPWLRILVEGFVIVGSILLAFGIDTWWDGLQQQAEEQRILTGLEADFSATVATLNTVVGRHRGYAERADALEGMSEAEMLAIPSDSVDLYMRAMAQYMTFEPRGGTLPALVAAGQLGLIQDPELRDLLAEWLQRLDDSSEEASFLTSIAEQIAIRMSRVVDLRKPVSAEDLVLIRSDAETMGLVRAKLFFGGLYAGELRRLQVRGDSVLSAVHAILR